MIEGKMKLMKKYAIVTDSASNILPEDCEGQDLYMLPLTITFGERSYRDKHDLTGDQLAAMLDHEKPLSSAPVLGDAQALIEVLKAKSYDGILGLSMPAALSSTYDVMAGVLDRVDVPSRLVDTQTVSIPQSEYVHHAQHLFGQGWDLDRVADLLSQKVLSGDAVFFAYVQSLDYLIAGGRLSRLQGIAGKVLQIKPIVNLSPEANVEVLEKMRGKKRTLAKMVEYAENFVQGKSYRIGFVYGRHPDQVKDLKDACAHLIEGADHVSEGQISTLIMAHSGPDVSAITLYRYDAY